MKYVYMPDGTTAYEIQLEKSPMFPGVSIKKRFSKTYLDLCIKVPDDTEVKEGWVFNKEDLKFAEPVPAPLIVENNEYEKVSHEVIENRIEALEMELSALKQQLVGTETEVSE